MPRVFIPPTLRDLTAGQEVIETDGTNVAEVIQQLEQRFPGIQARLCEGDALRTGLSVAVGTAVAPLGIRQPTAANDEVHFLPAIGGGH